ncbi:DUF4293 domain-containing protein [Cesiribacter andamanensis]|uniref:DUF4293 domain-containing protein n=1 Tax=Cesiribacter andamanensis AMV16 TaxID=1279009 RepID=M7NFV2_9BACT|nr:DUF4293 domain-containing protein [Cesiribacter andamanensis]EMR00695.1 hypothetical protein ADICEAN_04185 [Cesiribacter andamanensis AMV16]
MIQRIQTIFLLLVALCMGLTFGFPIWEKISTAQSQAVQVDVYQMTHYSFTDNNAAVVGEEIMTRSLWYVALLAGLATVIALFAIFQFRNRLTQIKLGALNALLIGATVVAAIYSIYQARELLPEDGNGQYLTGFWLPLGALFFNLLANRFIRRDELLVRSADRFR